MTSDVYSFITGAICGANAVVLSLAYASLRKGKAKA